MVTYTFAILVVLISAPLVAGALIMLIAYGKCVGDNENTTLARVLEGLEQEGPLTLTLNGDGRVVLTNARVSITHWSVPGPFGQSEFLHVKDRWTRTEQQDEVRMYVHPSLDAMVPSVPRVVGLKHWWQEQALLKVLRTTRDAERRMLPAIAAVARTTV